MGIESLNSAAAAAGFAMVSDDAADEAGVVHKTGSPEPGVRASGSPDAGAGQNFLPALFESGIRGAGSGTAALGARVTELLESWRSKG